MKGFNDALPAILEAEGGYVNDPDDRGGATNKGITQRTYDAWRESVGEGPRSVRDISDHEVAAIYRRDYWDAAKCDALPWPVAGAHFDAAVNHGVARACKMLQEACGASVDGIIGPRTLAAAREMEPRELFDALGWVRVRFYYEISTGTQIKFLRGWLHRLLHLRSRLT